MAKIAEEELLRIPTAKKMQQIKELLEEDEDFADALIAEIEAED